MPADLTKSNPSSGARYTPEPARPSECRIQCGARCRSLPCGSLRRSDRLQLMVRGAELQGCAIYGYIRSPSRQRPLCANSSRSPFTKQAARDIQNKTFATLLSGNPVRVSSDRRKKHPHREPMKRDGRQQDPGSSGQPFGGRATAERARALGLVGRVICHGPRRGRGQQSASWPLAFSRQEIAPRSQRVQAAISPVVQSSSGGDIRRHFSVLSVMP